MFITTAGGGMIAATVLGGLLGGKSGTQTQKSEPWGPAQDWMKQNIATGQKLQDYYQKNPFNEQQQAGINNTFANADNFAQNVAPGLMSFANNAMGSQYRRATGGAPGSGHSGLLSPGGTAAGMYSNQGLLGGSSQGPFSVAPQQAFGQMDFAANNPFTQAAQTEAQPAVDPNSEIMQQIQSLIDEQTKRQAMDDYNQRNA